MEEPILLKLAHAGKVCVMKKLWFLSGLCLALSLQAAEVLFHSDLQQVPQEMKLGKNCSVANGKLSINGINGINSSVISVPAEGDFIVRFTVTPVKPGIKVGHFGMDLCFKDKSSLKIYTVGTGWWLALYSAPGRKEIRSTLLTKSPVPTGEETSCILEFHSEYFTFQAGKNLSLRQEFMKDSLTQILFYGYNWDVDFSRIEVAPLLQENASETVTKKILLNENFENSVPVKGASTVDGVTGKAVKINQGADSLVLSLPESIGDNGTILFWFRPEQDSRFLFFRALGENGKTAHFSVGMDAVGMNTLLGRANGLKAQSARRWNEGAVSKDDWHLYAISFNRDGFVRIMFDAMSYYGFGGNEAWSSRYIPGLALSGIRSLDLRAGCSFDNVTVVNYAMNEAEMSGEFRKFVPVDIRMDDTVVPPETSSVLKFRVGPGGSMMTPPPYQTEPVKAKVAITVKITDLKDHLIAEKNYDLNVDRILECPLPPLNLKQDEKVRVGFYVNGVRNTTMLVSAWNVEAAKPVTVADYRKGELLFEQKFDDPDSPAFIKKGPVRNTGKYLEMGNNKYDCLAFPVPFPPKYRDGNPVLLEIDWPDDKQRNMGLYMYKPSTGKQLRDCLQGGIAAGNEYPNSGRIETARYLFYPRYDSYLFEARTLSSNYPAAIAGVRVYAIDGGLPNLKVNYPKGVPHRIFGHYDEDETFDYLLDHRFGYYDRYSNKVPNIANMLLDYLDYTGQELWAQSFLRYNWGYYPAIGNDSTGLYPYRPDWRPFMIRALAKRGKEVYAILDMERGMPEFENQQWRKKEWMDKGYLRQDPFGDLLDPRFGVEGVANLLAPEVENLFLGHVEQVLRHNSGNPNFTGIEYHQRSPMLGPDKKAAIPAQYAKHFAQKGIFSYDDFTIDLFRKEAAPEMPDFKGKDRFMKRFLYLLDPQREEKWEKWNGRKIAEHLQRVRQLVDRYNPEIKLFYCGWAPAVLPDRVFQEPMRQSTQFRWSLQHADKITDISDYNYSGVSDGKFTPKLTLYNSYNETFKDSPSPQYASYFQNADLKPAGRYILRDPVFCIAKYDMPEFTWGGQPLASMGREAEVRELARAYCALPALQFDSVPGATDPVTVRYLNRDNGTYVYCASLIFMDCTVALQGVEDLTDLSDGSIVKASEIRMKPYQLRSFLAKGKVTVTGAKVTVTPEFLKFYEKEFAATQSAIDELKKMNIDTSEAEQSWSKARAHFDRKEYSAAHTELFSAAWHRLKQKTKNLETLKNARAMLAQNILRVNCGSMSSYKTSDGRLFVPDARFADGLGYGYTGDSVTACVRDIGILKDSSEKELFRTEAYNIDAYKVTLKNGKYRVKLYLRWGYEPEFKQTDSVLDATVQVGSETRKIDFKKEMGGDFDKPFVVEFRNVSVRDGILEIRFLDGKTRRMLNALEITPES